MTAVAANKRLLRVVELAGPAGVGKTALSQALLRGSPGVPRSIWGQPATSLLGTGVQVGPLLLRFLRSSGCLLWDESRHIVRLESLNRSLRRDATQNFQLTVFDEGPIFALAWLRGFGHPIMRNRVSEFWWRAALRDWSGLVDAVVVLDAPDALLAERIRSRPEWHEVKEEPDWYIAAWMSRFRAALDWVLAGLAQNGGPAVVRIRADQDDPQGLAQRVAAALEPGP